MNRYRKQARLAAFVALLFLLAPGMPSVAAVPEGLSEAIAVQLALLESSPRDVALLNDLANLMVLAGDFGQAEDFYRRALEVNPDRLATHYNLALLYEASDRPKQARREFRRALEIDPNHAWSHYQLGRLADEDGNRGKAISYYLRAFSLEHRLTMPEYNPHILANDLAIPALLRAHADSSAAALAPRVYQNPGQVRDLLFPPIPAPVEPSRESTESTEATTGMTGGVGQSLSGGEPSSGSTLEAGEPSILRGSETQQPQPASPQGRPRGESRRVGPGRSAQPSDSPGTPVPVLQLPDRQAAPVPRPQPVPSPEPAQEQERLEQPAPADPFEPLPEAEPQPAPNDFEPDVFSTGRLEMRLIPKPPDVLAALPAAPR